MSESSPLLAIQCLAYNHEPYIRQCLDGFVMQKTDFPFIAIVHDDASTDKTADIIREYAEKYPDIIKPIFEKENQYSKHDGTIGRKMDNAIPTSVAYIALCEGDDYWTDSLKLQTQVDFLKSHLDYGMVYGKAKILVQKQKVLLKNTIGENFKSFRELLLKNTVPTLTVCYRSKLRTEYVMQIDGHIRGQWLMGDYPLWLYINTICKSHFDDRIYGVYRVLEESASHSDNYMKNYRFLKSSLEIQKYFAINEGDRLNKILDARNNVQMFYFLLLAQDKKKYKQSLIKQYKDKKYVYFVLSAAQMAFKGSNGLVKLIEKVKIRFMLFAESRKNFKKMLNSI